MILRVLIVLAALPAIDSLFRLLLRIASRSTTWRRPSAGEHRLRGGATLVVVPSRDEGEHVRATLQSAGKHVLLLLDGADPVGEKIARELGADVVTKEPAGPTKAAALAWLVANHRERILAHDAVLLLDVGSTMSDAFFDRLQWPEGCTAVQARLRGAGSGVGEAVAASETHAQLDEDRGREALGWSVRLRGTGSAFRSESFIAITPRLRTRVEDLEATLLLIARGERVALGSEDAFVIDDKPSTVHSAASQRARWLLGRYEVLFKRAADLSRAFIRKPFETTALLFEIFGRPLSLTVLFRAIVATIAIVHGYAIAWAILATALLDVAMFIGRTSFSAATRLLIAWMLAVIMAPRALFRWMRAKRS